MKEKIVNSIGEAEKIDNSIVIDLDLGVDLLTNFNKNTSKFKDTFKKLLKQKKGCDEHHQKKMSLKFIKDNILYSWKRDFGDPFFRGSYNKLDEETLLLYIFGLFVVGHTKKTQEKLPTIYKKTITEMSRKIFA